MNLLRHFVSCLIILSSFQLFAHERPGRVYPVATIELPGDITEDDFDSIKSIDYFWVGEKRGTAIVRRSEGEEDLALKLPRDLTNQLKDGDLIRFKSAAGEWLRAVSIATPEPHPTQVYEQDDALSSYKRSQSHGELFTKLWGLVKNSIPNKQN